jgi:predicted Zn-dependent protease
MLRRIVPLFVILSLLAAINPAPGGAMSTQKEVEIGQQEDQQIVESSVIETDPLLNAYVQGIADNLWNQVARKDVPYNIKIIKDDDINSFATMGGFVYVYEGLIDFVQSDDELASVIGHETGHIERRHVLTSSSKAQILNILFGIASIFSPLIYNFGGLAEAGLMAKVSREDELEADRYGLQLMARAGYDPESMVTMMAHLGVLQDEHSDLISKYLEDHPDPKARVAHLMGYPELDPTKVTPQQTLVEASGDEERARYSFARLRLTQALEKLPNNPEALLELGQAELALGLPNKSEQTLAEAAQLGNAATRADAQAHIKALRDMQADAVTFKDPDLPKLRSSVQAAQESHVQAASEIADRAAQGKDQLKAIDARLNDVQYEIPDLSNINVKRGTRLEAVLKNLTLMSRAVNSAMQDAGDPLKGVGSLERGKESGLLKESADIYGEMLRPLDMAPVPTDSVAILPSYPQMIDELSLADTEMLQSVDAGRAALTMLDQSIGDLDDFIKQIDQLRLSFNGDISQMEYSSIEPTMKKTLDEFDAAATAASKAAQLYNLARSRQLSTRITLLGLGTSPQRYSTLRTALKDRFGIDGISYHDMLRDGLTPGDVTAATIIAADIKSTPQAVIAEAKNAGSTIIDVANAHGMHAWPLEIFMGLVYLDYTDDPATELRRADGTEAVSLSQLGLAQ